jgi:hypothetical protein
MPAICFAVRHRGNEARLTRVCRRPPTASCRVSRHWASPREPASLPTGIKEVVALCTLVPQPS